MVPLFPLAARLRSEPELRQEALAILSGRGTAARIVAATRPARQAGVQAGLTLTQARVRLPKLIARQRDQECERAAQEALLDVAEGFSPRVEDAGEGLAYLDVDGIARLYPGDSPEIELGRTLLFEVEQRASLPVRLGIAASKLAARVAACQPASPTVVPVGGEAAFLAPLPMEQLSAESQTLRTLERWGIHTLGEFARLPKDEVISRLGHAGSHLQVIARGADPQPLVPRQVPPVFREGMELEWPLVNLEPFLFVARSALERLVQRMSAQGLGCQRLELSLALEPDGFHERSLTLPAPTREVKTLLTLLRLDLEAQPPAGAVLAFTLSAHPDRPREAQLSLFGPEALSPDQLATTLARLFALLGEDRVGAPQRVDAHLPERFALVPYQPPPPPKVRPERQPGRSLLAVRALRPPVPVEVITADSAPTPSGSAQPMDLAAATARPLEVKSLISDGAEKRPTIAGKVRVASGPWEVEEAWWSDQPIGREYWDVELADGALYRLFRNRFTGDWFIDGIYD